MKRIKLFPFVFIMYLFTTELSAQSTMMMMLNGKQNDLLGYSLQSATGTSKEISLFGPMQNALIDFQLSLQAAKAIAAVNITITDAASGTTTISLENVTVRSIKQYISTYTNGSFTVAPGGYVNMEAICKYEKIEIKNTTQKNQDNSDKIRTPVNPNDQVNGYETVIAKVAILNNEHVDIKVNGTKVLSYGDGDHQQDLGHFLKPGVLNNVTFSFNKGSFSKVELIGKFAGDKDGSSIYSFRPGKNGLEGTFEFPYAGVKPKQ